MTIILYVCLVLICLVVIPVGWMYTGNFVDESDAINALEVQGFSNVTIVEKDWFFVGFKGGAQEDNIKFTAIATNPAGRKVTVDVFAGWPFKGATIRYMK